MPCISKVHLLHSHLILISVGGTYAVSKLRACVAAGTRVCWSLVRRTSTWDVLRHVAVCSREQPDLAAELLSHLDTALHTERYTQRPAYGMALNAFKLQLLASSSDTTARIVCMVRWAASIILRVFGLSSCTWHAMLLRGLKLVSWCHQVSDCGNVCT